MTPQQFAELSAQDYSRIPVSREVLADTETPLSAYRKLADAPWTFLLESVQGGEKWGRYSIIGLPSRLRLEVRGYRAPRARGPFPSLRLVRSLARRSPAPEGQHTD